VVFVRLLAEVRGGRAGEATERLALRFIAGTFFALAGYVVLEGVRDLITQARPDTSVVGIVITGASIVVMPWLARAKRRVGQQLGSRLVLADAAETRLCAWLSVSTFAGLVGFALVGASWIDSIAGLVIAWFAVREGREAWAGEIGCDDGCDNGTEPPHTRLGQSAASSHSHSSRSHWRAQVSTVFPSPTSTRQDHHRV
jgi:hypothetical protein